MSKRIVWFDLETSGYKIGYHEVIQIGAIATDHSLKILEEFNQLIFFDVERASVEALEVNHYVPEIWRDNAVYPEDAMNLFSKFLKRHSTYGKISRAGNPYSVAEIGGYNTKFDIDHIKNLYQQHDEFLPMAYGTGEYIDILQMVRHFEFTFDLRLEKRKLGYVIEFLDVATKEEGELHDALQDVRLTIEIAKKLKYLMKGELA